MARITVPLTQSEKDALQQLAQRERRNVREQAAVIVVRELERLGLVPAEPLPEVPHAASSV